MLKRFQIDDPAFLDQIGARLDRASREAGADWRGLFSVTLTVPEIVLAGPPASLRGMFYWGRPGLGHHIFGLETVAVAEASGAARWHALGHAFAAWRTGWRHVDADNGGLAPMALGGGAFDDSVAEHAPDFPAARLSVPAVLLRQVGGISALTFSFLGGVDAAAMELAMERLRQLVSALAAQPSRAGHELALTRLSSSPDDAAWLARVAEAVKDIQSGRLDKVVLARSVSLGSSRPFDPARILAELARLHARSTVFGLETREGGVFLGASPELLAGLRDGEVYCDALAGTAWGEARGALVADVKNGREHRLVVQAVAEALRPMCSRLEVPAAPVALRLGHLQHLRSVLRGRVKTGVSLLDLLQRLHPTPAVGGYPRQAALDWLASHEEKRHGWYSGAVGWIDAAGDGEFAVALRCAKIQGDRAELYAGAGIVAGSAPQQELAETEAKLAVMLEALER